MSQVPTIGEMIKAKRKELGWSLVDVAMAMHPRGSWRQVRSVAASISRWERDLVKPRDYNLDKVATALQLEPS